MNQEDSVFRWLILAYHFPAKPGSARMKIWRRLQMIGAVAIKNSFYVLPSNDQTKEDFSWLLKELEGSEAEAVLFEARCIEGMDDGSVRDLFNQSRDSDYNELTKEIVNITDVQSTLLEGQPSDRHQAHKVLSRVRKRLGEIEAIDFFGAAKHGDVEKAMRKLEELTAPETEDTQCGVLTKMDMDSENLQGRTWVTRRSVGVDRMACAWLIRRWIDSDAKFKFVSGEGYQPEEGELRFDMFEGEFTHQGDLCTFEVMAHLIAPSDAAVRSVGEIVHDVDLKDSKFDRAETAGISALINGIRRNLDDDDKRLQRGGELFDGLYEAFREPG